MLLSTALLTSALLAGNGDDACSANTTATTVCAEKTIVETALGNEAFTTLVTALKAGELVEALSGEGPFTVFAPTNAAFAKLPEKQLASLLDPKNKSLLQAVLTYHVAPGNMPAAKVMKSKNATTLNGQRIDFTKSDSGFMVDGAKITKTDIGCSNGVIHVIDSVILPSTIDIVATAIEAGSFTTLATALEAAHLVEALQGEGPFTVFAPTDEAFAALPEGTVANLLKPENRKQLAAILKLHVVSGRIYSEAAAAGAKLVTLNGQSIKTVAKDDQVMVNGARVVSADIESSNGVIHVIDSVLLPE